MLSAEALAVIGGVSAVGSLLTGWLGSRYPKHIILGLLYIIRAVIFAAYFILPPTPTSTLLFAAAMGLLWWPGLAPLIGGLVAEIFGTRYMATLLGLSFVVHQVGSSLGAWGGGLIFDFSGSYDAAWQIGTVWVRGRDRSNSGRRPEPWTQSCDYACDRDNVIATRDRELNVCLWH